MILSDQTKFKAVEGAYSKGCFPLQDIFDQDICSFINLACYRIQRHRIATLKTWSLVKCYMLHGSKTESLEVFATRIISILSHSKHLPSSLPLWVGIFFKLIFSDSWHCRWISAWKRGPQALIHRKILLRRSSGCSTRSTWLTSMCGLRWMRSLPLISRRLGLSGPSKLLFSTIIYDCKAYHKFLRHHSGCIDEKAAVWHLVGEEEDRVWQELTGHTGEMESKGEDSENEDGSS